MKSYKDFVDDGDIEYFFECLTEEEFDQLYFEINQLNEEIPKLNPGAIASGVASGIGNIIKQGKKYGPRAAKGARDLAGKIKKGGEKGLEFAKDQFTKYRKRRKAEEIIRDTQRQGKRPSAAQRRQQQRKQRQQREQKKPKQEKPKQEKPKQEKPKQEKPKQEKPTKDRFKKRDLINKPLRVADRGTRIVGRAASTVASVGNAIRTKGNYGSGGKEGSVQSGLSQRRTGP